MFCTGGFTEQNALHIVWISVEIVDSESNNTKQINKCRCGFVTESSNRIKTKTPNRFNDIETLFCDTNTEHPN